jgi:hypothetical protein
MKYPTGASDQVLMSDAAGLLSLASPRRNYKKSFITYQERIYSYSYYFYLKQQQQQ